MAASRPLLEIGGLVKRFGAVTALAGADLRIAAGEVQGLVGENGAGKSTLIRIASGLVRADGGEIRLDGRTFHPRSPRDANVHGIRVVSQEFDLAPNVTVAENLCLSSQAFLATCRNGRFSRRRAQSWAGEQLARVGVDLDPTEKVADLSVSQRQLVALVQGVLDDPRIFFLDEPSSALDREGVRILSALVRRLRQKSVAVVYVSHKLEEIFDLADRITVMRDGRSIASHPRSETTMEEVVALMVGREIDRMFPERPSRPSGAPVLEVEDLHAPGVHGADLTVRRGEIVGLGGLVGAGRTELARALSGLAPLHRGRIWLDGAAVDVEDRATALRLGIEYVTEDRLGEGLVSTRPLAENVSSRIMGSLSRGPFVSAAAERRAAERAIADFKIAAPNGGVPVRSLSGGNQQKTLLAACLSTDPKVVFFDEPTRGIDVGAKAQIYRLIRDFARDRAVVVICSELIELIGLADRILIMRRGRFVGEFDPAVATEETLVRAALGVEEGNGSRGDAKRRVAPVIESRGG